MNVKKIEELKTLYAQSSKHSNYQILSKRLSSILGNNEIEVKTRYETERLNFIMKNIEVEEKTVLDIGGNTGYFSLELLDARAKKVHYYEGNKAHADFVGLAASVLKIKKKLEITNEYLSFENELKGESYDLVLLLNVLHHLGDDYGNQQMSIELAKQNIIKQLNSLADKTTFLVFQLGFNWKGNRKIGLFENGTKKELIDFIHSGIENYWEVLKIGIAESAGNGYEYNDLNDKNIQRDDQLGEFLNRPVFILKSLI